MLKTIIAVLTV